MQKTKNPVKEIFCANDQKVTKHEVTYVNGEFVCTCECGRFVKFPGNLKAEGLAKAIKRHEEVNADQVTQAAVDKEEEEKLKLILDA